MKADKTINFLMYIAGMAFNLVIMALLGYFILNAFRWGYDGGIEFAEDLTAVGENIDIEFTIYDETSPSQIAKRLADDGIIRNRYMFQLELFLRSRSGNYAAGTFVVNPSMNNVEIDRALRMRPEEVAPFETIQIPEGWTIRDMAEYFEERGFNFTCNCSDNTHTSVEEFIYVAQEGFFSFSFLLDIPQDRPNRLEGYLFPDTYQIPVNPNPGDIITRMLNNFDVKIADDEIQMRLDEMNMSIDEVIILASIIERETRLASERPLVSQVMHSRIARGMRLDMDSTVKYAMDDPPLRLLYAHLDIESPYNTYRITGLPIGPISNPGIAAIEAVLWPSDTDYLYFVLMDEETGQHHFSRSLEEHNAAVARYR